MGWIASEIVLAIELLNVRAKKLPKDKSEYIKNLVANKLNVSRPLWHLWEMLADDVSVRDSESWRWVSGFLENNSVIMFFNEDDDISVFEFQDGKDIVPVLAETNSFEFYLTDKSISYTLCFNHHDYLVATGTAADWLRRRIENTPH